MSIITLFDRQAAANPNDIAVRYNDTVLTYAELQQKADALSNHLKEQYQLKANDLVGIMLDRSEKMIVAILGVLKSGAAYVPIDPAYPTMRKEYVLKDAGIRTLIAQTEYIFDLDYYGGAVFAMDVQFDSLEHTAQPATEIDPADTAYVIYTSGSTGEPKGCVIAHSNLLAYIQWANGYYFREQERADFGLYTSLSFDLTVTSIFCSLTRGGCLYVYAAQQELVDIFRHSFSAESGINSIKLTPSHINLLKHLDIASTSMVRAIIGGEQVTTEQVSILKQINPGIAIYNEYGPTETTVGCIVKQLELNEPIQIGKPITGANIYILKDGSRLCATGVPGEICIGGAGVGKGYLNKPELTAEKFVASPFNNGERMYRSGDTGKWMADGNIVFIGRKDEQVKIRGYRIEPGEIEARLHGYPDVEAAVVVTRTNKEGENELAAYIAGNDAVDIAKLRSHLSGSLPVYAIPAHFVLLDKMPLTANGKVDKKALPGIDGKAARHGAEYVAPRNSMEEKFVAVWEKVLEKEKIGIKDSFFDLGGDSIKVLRIISEIKKELGLEIPLTLIYQNNTIENIASEMSRNMGEIETRNKQLHEQEEVVKKDLNELKNRIFSSMDPAQQEKIEDVYPMSDIEKGMLFASMLDENLGVYHDQFLFRQQFIDFDVNRFTKALGLLVEKHSMLRTSFNLTDYETEMKFVHKHVKTLVDHRDLSTLTPEEQEKEISAYMRGDVENPFKPGVAPLWRMSVFYLGGNEWSFLWQFHHAISDGWSTASFITELNNCYINLSRDAAYQPEKLRSDYKDFIVRHIIDQQDEQVRTFWRNELEDYTRLDLFTTEEQVEGHYFFFETDVFDRVEKRALELNTTVKVISLGAYLYILRLLNYGNDILVGVVTNTRPNIEDSDKVLGCFLNTIPLRMEVHGSESCADFIGRLNNKLVALKDKERLSLPVISLINNEQQDSGNPFFDVLFNFVDFHAYHALINDGSMQEDEAAGPSYIGGRERTNTYMDCTIGATGKRYVFNLRLTKKLRSGFNGKQIGELYARIVNYFIDAPEQELKDLNWMDTAEKQSLLAKLNNTAVTYPTDATLVSLFEEQVSKTPGNTAVSFEGKQLSYAELNEAANQLANYLRSNYAIVPDDLVGVKLERSEWMVIALLAILKAGAAYVPIDPAYPAERIEYMIADSQCKTLVDEAALNRFRNEQDKYDTQNLQRVNQAENLAYVIYTSGTTGKPKGTLIEHRNVVRLFFTSQPLFNFTSADVWTLFHSYCFDFSVWEMYGALLFGGKLVVVPFETARNPEAFAELLQKEGVTVLNQTPSSFYNLSRIVLDNEAMNLQLDYVIFGGEALSPGNLRAWHRKYPNTKLVNMYGITETTVHVTYKEITGTEIAANSSNIGKPIPTLSCYVLDQDLNLLPAGVPGELFIGGAGVARGYLNRPELTSQRFMESPFDSNERLYRSGDQVMMLQNDELEYMGRIDQQVKIRGYRIELSEIENTLAGFEDITGAVVIARTVANDEKELAAYITGEQKLDPANIKRRLSDILPEYMVPATFVQLDELPLTVNGKIDRKRLPEISGASASATAFTDPRNNMESSLAAIWRSVLNKESISVTEDFFDAGGNSLKITRLAALIHKEMNIRLQLKELFANRTVESQARLAESSRQSSFSAIVPAAVQSYYPLSSAQRRLWVLSQFEESNKAYNIFAAYVLEGMLDKRALEYAFGQLVARHEILRTVFKADERGEVWQYVQPAEGVTFDIAYSTAGSEAEARELVQQEIDTPFDLATGPLLRVNLVKLASDKWVLVYVMHHIISDAWSMEIIMKEMLALYGSQQNGKVNALKPLRIQYKDYASWQQEQLYSKNLQWHQQYWLQQLHGEAPVLDLPTDKPRPAVKTYRGRAISKKLPAQLSNGIKELGRQQDATTFMALLAMVNVLLSRYSGQQDIVMGSPIAGRQHADLANQVGYYLNTVALKARFSPDDNFSQLLHNIRNVTTEAYEHQDYPFEQLVDELQLSRDISHSPLFDVFIDFHDARIAPLSQNKMPEGLKVTAWESEQSYSKFDLTFVFSDAGDDLYLSVTYNSDLFEPQTIERLYDHFEELLQAVIASPQQPVGSLKFITDDERSTLLNKFNPEWEGIEYMPVTALFEVQVNDKVAVVFKESTLSYKELDERANSLANYLIGHYGINAGDSVGIMLDRSEKMVISILGVLKSGAAYVPIDAAYPTERRQYIMQDSGIKALITQSDYIFDLASFQGDVLAIDVQLDAMSASTNKPGTQQRPEDIAYIIYTSGSTGNPKGCAITHANLSHYIQWANSYYFNSGAAPVMPLYTSLSFDLTVTSIFCTLTSGGRLMVYDQQQELNATLQHIFSNASGIDSIKLTPSHINILKLLDVGTAAIETAIVGGEQLTTEQVRTLNAINPAMKIFNEYGPTETTVGCVVKQIEDGPIVIGKPIRNTSIYILDDQGALCPVGIKGEICIAGHGVGNGYINNPQLTAEKFVDDPFRAGGRMYKTGDLGRWLANGDIEFIGRKDDQLKIRGYRIEPGEIENTLQNHEGVDAVAVMAFAGQDGDTELAAYYTARQAFSAAELRASLSKQLPAYMIPAHFVQLDNMPLTENGKIDRKQLPAPTTTGTSAGAEYVAPRNETEEKLVELWKEILGAENIGVKDSFFDLGGHSLKATRLLSRIKKDFMVEVSIADFFAEATIEALADAISNDQWLQSSLDEQGDVYTEIKS